jgi:hypothetical protein
MFDTTVFAFGAFVFLLLLGGLIFTVIEMKRIGREAEVNSPSTRASVPISPKESDGLAMPQIENRSAGRAR